VIRRIAGPIVVAAALVALFVLAFVLALAQGKLSLLALGLTEHLFGIVLAVFVLERILTWREERRWLTAKNWLYLLLLETIDDLLKQLLPATVTQKAAGTGEKVTVYEVTGERIHFGEAAAYSPLHLLVRPNERALQSYITWYATELGPPRYTEQAKEALAEARTQIRDTFGSSAQLMEADITAMLISLEQAALAAMRHLDSAAVIQEERLYGASYPDDEVSAKRRTPQSDHELALTISIILESVVDSAIRPKAWLEDQMYRREGQSLLRRL
jgi:hypothetical protein